MLFINKKEMQGRKEGNYNQIESNPLEEEKHERNFYNHRRKEHFRRRKIELIDNIA